MTSAFTHLKLLLVDLDDTLLHTSRLLVPAAHREAVAAMRAAGLSGTLEDCLATRFELSAKVPPDQLCLAQLKAAGMEGHPLAASIVSAGEAAYFDRDVGPIHLEDGLEAMLRRLVGHLTCVLVTSGVERTQQQKVKRLGLDYLHEVVYVPVGGREVKQGAFEAQLRKRGLRGRQAAVVGDRPDSEILAGRALGCWTVRIRRGEHRKRALHVDADLTIEQPLHIDACLYQIDDMIGRGLSPRTIPSLQVD